MRMSYAFEPNWVPRDPHEASHSGELPEESGYRYVPRAPARQGRAEVNWAIRTGSPAITPRREQLQRAAPEHSQLFRCLRI
jgi:hypothetical protein